MNFGPCEVKGCRDGKGPGAKAQLACLRDEHVYATVSEGEELRSFALGFGGKAKLVDRGRINQQRAGIHGVDLHGDGFAVDGKACGRDDGWTVVAKGDESDIPAGAGTRSRGNEGLGDAEHGDGCVELKDAVLEGFVSDSAVNVREGIGSDGAGKIRYNVLDIFEGDIPDDQVGELGLRVARDGFSICTVDRSECETERLGGFQVEDGVGIACVDA
jgi:hypothetical protein